LVGEMHNSLQTNYEEVLAILRGPLLMVQSQ